MQYKEDNQVKQATHGELYAEVYRRYAPALFAYVCRHVSSREDVEDIVLEVFLSVLQNQQFPTFGQEKQKAWLWAITCNKTVDYFRRTTRQRQISLEWLAEPLYADDATSPEQISLAHEEYLHFVKAVSKLPTHQQEVLRLRFGHDLNSHEIASVLEKSGASVRMLLSRTLRLLRGHYKDQTEGGQSSDTPLKS